MKQVFSKTVLNNNKLGKELIKFACYFYFVKKKFLEGTADKRRKTIWFS